MNVLGIILARAGSRGLPNKCMRDLLGQPMIRYTIDHALQCNALSDVILSTDSEPAKAVALSAGIEVVDRPQELASDLATVDAAARHAVESWELSHGASVDAVVLLYGNIPVRQPGLLGRAIRHLQRSNADSVRSVAKVSKQHPDWLHRLEADVMAQYRPNSIYRRQDLTPLYYHDGAAVVVRRDALFGALETPDDHQAFLGKDRRAIIQGPEDSVDVDEALDLVIAEGILRSRQEAVVNTTSPHENLVPRVKIDTRTISCGQPIYVIAEAGVNHNGKLSRAIEMVDAAAGAGADAIKFQVFSAERLASKDAPTARYQRCSDDATSQRSLLEGLELSFEDFREIRDHCKTRAITFLATPFGLEDVAVLEALKVDVIKTASTDLPNKRLLEAVSRVGSPLIVSTGASTVAEIHQSVDWLLRRVGPERLILLHCVSSYPAPLESINLGAIRTMAEAFSVPVGFSDHTQSVQTGGWAVAAGACVLEKHFTLDKTLDGPDHAMSLTPDDLKEYVSGARNAFRALGNGVLGLTELEAEVRSVARKSVVAARDIPAGIAIGAGDLTLKRPGTGITADHFDELLGRRTTVPIHRDTLFDWDMIE